MKVQVLLLSSLSVNLSKYIKREHDIVKFLFNQGDDDFRCYWVGGKRNYQGDFVYDDGSSVDMGKFWMNGQPDNAGLGEDCVALFEEEYLLNDMDCNTLCRFFCEIP